MKYLVKVDGISYSFDIINDLTEPCSTCGVPACGKDDYFWYVENGIRKTLVLDGSILDLIIQESFPSNIQKVAYKKFPRFLRESNECIGWSAAEDFNGTTLDIDDLILALELIDSNLFEDWIKSDAILYIGELKKIAGIAKANNKSLLVARN